MMPAAAETYARPGPAPFRPAEIVAHVLDTRATAEAAQ